MIKTREHISCCGVICNECPSYPDTCQGCNTIKGKPYWLAYVEEEVCSIYNCCVQQHRYAHCAMCNKLPCKHYETSDPTKTEEENLADHMSQMKILKELSENHKI